MEIVTRAELPAIDPRSVKLRGYAAIYGNVFKQSSWFFTHRYVIEPGAFAGALERLNGAPLPIALGHNIVSSPWALQIGETTILKEDSRGLYFEGNVFETREAMDVISVMAGRDKPIGASVSFNFGEVTEDDEGIEHVHSFSEIFELGPTTWGANSAAYAELVDANAKEETAEPEPDEEEPAPAEEDTEDDEQAETESSVLLTASLWRATAEIRRFQHERKAVLCQ